MPQIIHVFTPTLLQFMGKNLLKKTPSNKLGRTLKLGKVRLGLVEKFPTR